MVLRDPGTGPEERDRGFIDLQADTCARIMLLHWPYATHLLRCIVLTAEKPTHE